MKKYVKILFIVLVLCISISLLTGCNGGNTSANDRESVSFLEIGEDYYLTGIFRDSTYGSNVGSAQVKVLAIENNWIKVKNTEGANNPDMFESMGSPKSKWGYFWINLDNVTGVVK